MSDREADEELDAPPPPGFSTPTKVNGNDGAGHAEPDAEGTESESDADAEKQFDESTGKKRAYHPFRQYTEIKRWKTGAESELEDEQIDHEIYTHMKKFMQQSRLLKSPGHKQLDSDVGLWKLQRAEYYNSRTEEWIRVYQCPLHYRCKCNALCRILVGKDYKRLEFFGTHDENSHANDNSTDKHLHMDPAQLRLIQRRVRSARQELTKQKLDTSTVPESLGELTAWCAEHDFHAALAKHNDPSDDYVLPLFSAFVLGSDIKPERQAIHINLSAPWFLMNAIRAIETGWTVQLNGDATFSFCRAAVDMIGLGFCSMGGANHPACWSLIPHQTEGELMYTVSFREMERAALALFGANLDKTCEFTTCLKHLIAQPRVMTFVASQAFLSRRLPIDQAQCDHQAGWRNFSLNTFGKEPNICSNHVTGEYCLPSPLRVIDMLFRACRHCRRLQLARPILRR